MQVSVEKVSNVECRLTIVLPANVVETAYTNQLDKYLKTAKIDGFRPGKAPRSYIEKKYGKQAHEEALGSLMQQSLYEAITDKNLKPLRTLRVEPKAFAPSQPFEFSAVIEVLPEIDQINFSMESVEKLNVNVTAEDVEKVLEQLSKQYTKWTEVNRPAQLKDRVVIDYYTTFDGKSDAEHPVQNFPLELGSKVMLAGFEDALIGVKAGDERTIELTFPADFNVTEHANKPITFHVKVKQVYEAEMPEMNEEFVQKLGIQSGKVEDLKQQIQQSLEHERDRLVKEKLKEQLFKQLLEQNPVEVPSSLVEREARQIHDEYYPQNQHHDHHQHSPEEMNAFNDIAKKRVALGLLIAEYAKKNGLEAADEDVQKRIKEIASVYENPDEVIAWLSSQERRQGIESQVIEDHVMNKLMEAVSINEKVISYAELKGVRI